MKKLLFGAFCVFLAAYMISISGCRTRVASAPGPEWTITLTATATIYLTPTITPTSAPVSLTYDFEGSLDGWSKGGGTGFTAIAYVLASSVPGGVVISGNYCLSATCSFLVAIPTPTTDGEVVVNPVPSDLSAVSQITAHVYVPADMPAGYSVQVFVLTGTGYAFAGQNDATPTLGAWNTVTLNTSGIANMNNVDAIAVQILRNSGPAWSGTIYVDDVTVN